MSSLWNAQPSRRRPDTLRPSIGETRGRWSRDREMCFHLYPPSLPKGTTAVSSCCDRFEWVSSACTRVRFTPRVSPSTVHGNDAWIAWATTCKSAVDYISFSLFRCSHLGGSSDEGSSNPPVPTRNLNFCLFPFGLCFGKENGGGGLSRKRRRGNVDYVALQRRLQVRPWGIILSLAYGVVSESGSLELVFLPPW